MLYQDQEDQIYLEMIDASEGEKGAPLLSPGNKANLPLEEIELRLSAVYRDLSKYRNVDAEDLSEFEGELKDIEDRCFDILNLLRASEKKSQALFAECEETSETLQSEFSNFDSQHRNGDTVFQNKIALAKLMLQDENRSRALREIKFYKGEAKRSQMKVREIDHDLLEAIHTNQILRQLAIQAKEILDQGSLEDLQNTSRSASQFDIS